MSSEPVFPGAAHLDYNCVLGSASITATWLVSDQPPDAVAAWYRAQLNDFAETEPGCWLRSDPGKVRRLVHVGPAHSWPQDRPAPGNPPPASAQTLILHSTMQPRP